MLETTTCGELAGSIEPAPHQERTLTHYVLH
jgi:hypothetical protein